MKPKKNEIVERLRFHRTERQGGQNAMDYAAELRGQAATCNFEDNLDGILRDQFVWGICYERNQAQLLKSVDLTFDSAVRLAAAQEKADRGTRDLAGTTSKTVHSLTNRKVDKCCHCGRSSHREKNCKFRNAECFGCHKRGHICAVCTLVGREKKDHSRRGRQHYLAEDDDSSMSEELVEVTDRLVDGSPMFMSRPTSDISGVAPPVQLVQ